MSPLLGLYSSCLWVMDITTTQPVIYHVSPRSALTCLPACLSCAFSRSLARVRSLFSLAGFCIPFLIFFLIFFSFCVSLLCSLFISLSLIPLICFSFFLFSCPLCLLSLPSLSPPCFSFYLSLRFSSFSISFSLSFSLQHLFLSLTL